MQEIKKGNFSLNHDRWSASNLGSTNDDMYDCTDCVAAEREHKIISIPGPPVQETQRHAVKGETTTKRKCTGCGAEDGPWVPA